eukprot:gnl/TRDRNA2_/TRDRNA2_172670_c1_seq6.p1 gnl/TRDRNA2_/TRDRNA2_172670_c1~~gnl/TRDRNA2_/TRDRNA2_172670_c1_seq6.p1  ORF type:complete len:122 (+),score=0.75 gnl/TRDRNA2_/TRDRNA2_172670_c1_seq6:296-661(+)
MEKWVKQFLPNCEIHLLKDGNHLGLMSHSLAWTDLPDHVTPKQLRAEIVEQVADFLGWPNKTGNSVGANSSHNVTPKQSRPKSHNVTPKQSRPKSHNVTPKQSRTKFALQRNAKVIASRGR